MLCLQPEDMQCRGEKGPIYLFFLLHCVIGFYKKSRLYILKFTAIVLGKALVA
jgi:hypothetical protein